MSTFVRRPVSMRSKSANRIIESLEPRYLLAAIASDNTVAGSIDVVGEVDEYTFQANAGDAVIAFVAETATGAFDPALELIAPNAASLGVDQGEVGADLFPNALTQSGTYTLRVFDSGSNDTGGYAVTLVKVPGLQSANDGNGGALVSGGRSTGTISTGDLDVYTFGASAGENVILSIAEAATTGFQPHMRVYGPTGTLLTEDYGDISADLFIPTSGAGNYYVVVKDLVSQFTFDDDIQTGDYALRMVRLPGTQASDDGDGGALVSGGRASGTIDVGDLDVFTFTANANENVILSIAETTTTDFEPHMLAYGPSGASVTEDYGDVGADLFITPSSPGTYSVVVKDLVAQFTSDGDIDTGTYALRMLRMPSAQTSDDGNGGELTSGGRATGTIDIGDLDIYTFTANAGDNIVLSIADTDQVANFQPHALVYSPTGAFLLEDYGEVGADLYVAAAEPGTYYVAVKDLVAQFASDGDVDEGAYALRMVRLPAVQGSDDGDGGALVSGARVTGRIDIGDLDVFTVAADAGDSILGIVRSIESGAGDAQVQLYSPTGVLLDSSNGSTDAAVEANNVVASGDYFVLVKDLVAQFASDGDVEETEYAMTFAVAAGAQPADADSGVLASGTPRAGAVSVGDIDVYTFSATAGQSFTINLSETTTSGFDPALRLLNPAGTLVTTQSGAAAASFTVANPPSSGTYTAFVFDSGGDESGAYSIALNAATAGDDFAPRVLDTEYRFNAAPPELRVIFSEAIGASFSPDDIEIVDVATNTPVSNLALAMTYENGDDLLKVSFPALPGRVLADGNYELRINRNGIQDAAANLLDADLAFGFFVLAGDANRDRIVNVGDLGILATNWQRTLRVFGQGDFNYDGKVDVGDLGILATNWQKQVAPPPAAMRGSPFASAAARSHQRLTPVSASVLAEDDGTASVMPGPSRRGR